MNKKTNNKYNLSDKDLTIYNYMAHVLGILSIALATTGLFGVVCGLLGLCLSLTYYDVKKEVKISYVICLVGSLASAVFIAYMLYLARVM